MPSNHGYDFSKMTIEDVRKIGRIKGESPLHQISANGHTSVADAAATAIEKARVFTAEMPKAGVKGVIRQSSRRMNKTEGRFELEHIKPLYYEQEITDWDYEAHTLKIANGCRYTPDFWAINRKGVTVYYEIKARAMIWDDAIVKLKVAASKYVNCEFYLCAWSAQGWTIERVLA